MADYHSLFQPYTFRSGVDLPNRLVIPPMTTTAAFQNGMSTQDEYAYYARRSGGAGLFITACAYVDFIGKSFPGQIAVDDDKYIPSLAKLAETIKSKGSKAVLQIVHGGRMIYHDTIGAHQPLSASHVPAEFLKDKMPPRPMTEEEILTTIEAFGQATRRAIEAGFDGVEIHGANTYLLQQFFSPHSNRREDDWGGSLEKRMRFPLAVVDQVLASVEKYADRPFLVGYRISPEEVEEPGICLEDTYQLVDKLADKELDYLHISLGHYEQGSVRDKTDTRPVLYRLKELVHNRLPLIGVGGINHPDAALELLEQGIDFAAVGRAIIIDPDWVEKVATGRVDDILSTLDTSRQEELALPLAFVDYLLSRPNWLPVKEENSKS